MVEVRVADKRKFLMVHFPTLDELINLLLKGEINGKEFALFQWMCSYAWFVVGRGRNDFTIPISAVAKAYQVERGTTEKWLTNLARLKLVEPKYWVKVHSNMSERKMCFKTQDEAWVYKNKHGGTQLPTTYKILMKGIQAKMGNKKSNAERGKS